VRSYIKIQEIFASIGGLISIINIIFKILCDYLVYPDILRTFYNQVNKKHLLEINNKNGHEKLDSKFGLYNNLQNENLDKSQINNNASSDQSNLRNNNIIYQKNNFIGDALANKNSSNVNNINLKDQSNNLISNENNDAKKAPNQNSDLKYKQIGYQKFVQIKSVAKVFNFEFENMSLWEKITREFNCFNNEKKKKYNLVQDFYHKMFSFEYCINNFRIQEIMRFLLLDEKQNSLIENVDMPDLSFSYDEKVNSLKELGSSLSDSMTDLKLKLLLN
jgi:hypothetical protein